MTKVRLYVDAGTRTLTGTPKALGTYRMTYSVVEDDDDRASLQFAVTVGGGKALYRQLHGQILSQYALTIATDAGRAVAERVDRLAQGQAPRFATNADGSEFEIPLSSQGGSWSLDASRQRAFLAVSSPNLLEGVNQELLLSGELGSRTDDSGVGASSDLAVGMPDGSGSEIGVKLRYTSKYVTMEVGGRSLSADSGGAGEKFEESGWYLSFSLTPKPGERGLALSLKPSWGNTGSGLDDLWEDEQLPAVGSVGGGAGVGRGRMDAELSYGFGVSGGGEAVLSPYSKISAAEGSAHSGAFGVRLKLGKAFDLNFEHSDQYGAEALDDKGRFRLGGTLRL